MGCGFSFHSNWILPKMLVIAFLRTWFTVLTLLLNLFQLSFCFWAYNFICHLETSCLLCSADDYLYQLWFSFLSVYFIFYLMAKSGFFHIFYFSGDFQIILVLTYFEKVFPLHHFVGTLFFYIEIHPQEIFSTIQIYETLWTSKISQMILSFPNSVLL